MSNEFIEQLKIILYGEIESQVKNYNECQDIEKSLFFIDPTNFKNIFYRACYNASSYVINGLVSLHEELISQNDFFSQCEDLHLGEDSTDYLFNESVSLGKEYFRYLDQLDSMISNLRHKLMSASERAENQGKGWGVLGGIVGGALLGPLGALVAAAGAGYYGGSLISDDVERSMNQIHDVLVLSLGEYDSCVERIASDLIEINNSYLNTVEKYVNVLEEQDSAMYLSDYENGNVQSAPFDNSPNAMNIEINDEWKICPMCAETVRFAAKICRFCRHQF